MQGSVVQLNIKPETAGERGMPKRPVDTLTLTAAGADGDYNRWRAEKAAGDPDQAILLISEEQLAGLRAEGWPVEPGTLGENITMRGIPAAVMVPGARVRLGDVVLEVSKPCPPCGLVGVLPGIGPARVDAFRSTLAGRRGWYARVVAGGVVTVGSAIEVIPAAQASFAGQGRPG